MERRILMALILAIALPSLAGCASKQSQSSAAVPGAATTSGLATNTTNPAIHVVETPKPVVQDAIGRWTKGAQGCLGAFWQPQLKGVTWDGVPLNQSTVGKQWTADFTSNATNAGWAVAFLDGEPGSNIGQSTQGSTTPGTAATMVGTVPTGFTWVVWSSCGADAKVVYHAGDP